MANIGRLRFKRADIDFQYEINRTRANHAPRFTKVGSFWTNNATDDGNGAIILCGGDLMCEPRMSEACCFDGEYDFRVCFKPLKPVFQDADLVVANLETIVSERFPYAHEKHRVDHHTGVRYHCNAPIAYLDALRYAGFDGFVLANNHNADGGYEGIVDTLASVDARGFMRTGMFFDENDQRVLLVEVNGIRLAILSYTEHINRGLDTELLTTKGRDVMLNLYSADKVVDDISMARSMGAEFVLVYIHMLGKEYSNEVRPRQRETALAIANAGADCIMGSHMHALQQYEQVKAADGRLVPIVHSLGNLITSDNTGSMTRRNVLYRLHLMRDKSGSVYIAGDSYIPLRTVEGTKSSSYISFPVQKEYRGNYASTLFEKAEADIAKEIGPMLQLAPGEDDFASA